MPASTRLDRSLTEKHIRTFAVLLGEDQVVGILAPVDAGVVGFKLDLEILALSGILLVQGARQQPEPRPEW